MIPGKVQRGTVSGSYTVLEVTSGDRTVFLLPPGGVAEIMAGAQQLWGRIFFEWFTTSGYQQHTALELELYFGLKAGR